MIDFSTKRKSRAKAEKVDVRQLAVAELMAWGWDPVDAMLAVGFVKESDEKVEAAHAAVAFTTSDAITKLVRKRQAQMRGGCVLDEYQKIHPTPGGQSDGRGAKKGSSISATNNPTYLERKLWQGEIAPVGDEEILATMWDTITKLKPEDPKRVDLLDKYDRLKRRQGIGEDDTTIHFYLPRPECDTCPFRGSHVITEPEAAAVAEPEKQTEEEDAPEDSGKKDYYVPRPGYSVNGKKLGRPPKRHYKKREKKPKEEV